MSLFHAALQPALDSDGSPISGATWNFSLTGTLTAANVYSDNALTTSLGSTVTANAAGRFAVIFLDDAVRYRAILKDAGGTTIKDIDPASDRTSDALVTPEQYGALGDGVTDDEAACQAALNALSGGGVLQFTPGSTYKLGGGLSVANAKVTVLAHGATITSAMTASEGLISLGGADCTIEGGDWVLTSGDDAPWLFNVTGINCRIAGATFRKDPTAGGYIGYVRHTADGFRFVENRTYNSNGIFNEASDVVYGFNQFEGRATGGDDAIAIKAIQGVCEQVRIIGNSFRNLAYFCSMGSEIGTLAANDSTYSKAVRLVSIIGNTGYACSGILFIKPGAIAEYDYCDGLVEDVVCSNNVLNDLTGLKFSRGIGLTPSRGAIIRRVSGRNNVINARAIAGSSRKVGAIDCYIPDYSGLTAGTGVPKLEDIDIQVHYSDPYDGAAYHVTNSPGYPVTYGCAVEREAPAYGTMARIKLDVKVNGSAETGALVTASLDDVVTFDGVNLRNVNVTNAAGQGGLYTLSRVRLVNASITPSAGSEFSLGASGAVEWGNALYVTVGSLPTAAAHYRGRIAYERGGTGVADTLKVCRKDAADAYAWTALF